MIGHISIPRSQRIQNHDAVRVSVHLADCNLELVISQGILQRLVAPVLVPNRLPLSLDAIFQLLPKHFGEEPSLAVSVEQADDDLALFSSRKRLVMAHLARKQQVHVEVGQQRAARAGTNANTADLHVANVRILRNCNGEAFRVVQALAYPVEERGQRLCLVEFDNAAHARAGVGLELGRVGFDGAAGVWDRACSGCTFGEAERGLAGVVLQLEGWALNGECWLALWLDKGIVVALALRCGRDCGRGRGVVAGLCARHNVSEPVAQPSWRRVDGRVWAVDADAMADEAEERLLLRVCERERLEATEDDGMVCDDNGRLAGDGLIGDSFGQVNCEEHRVVLSAGRVKGRLQQQSSVVP